MVRAATLETDTVVRRNGAVMDAEARPYVVALMIVGTASILFHRWDCDEVAEKGKAAKGSKRKREDNLESYVYRCEDQTLGVPGINFKGALVESARYSQDPRSPRKSARDLFKAGLLVMPEVASFGLSMWEFEARHRAPIQRQGITRIRPGLRAGWHLEFEVHVLAPEYITEPLLHEVTGRAGQLVGLCDFRPEFGRFRVDEFKRIELRA